jgi:hypothetical protein
MDVLKIIAENKILEAQAEGAFDNLDGAGKPLAIESIHPAGEEQFLANHVLRQNRFLPVWLEERKELQRLIATFSDLSGLGEFDLESVHTSIEQLNRRISGYNLRVPVESLRLLPVAIPELVSRER